MNDEQNYNNKDPRVGFLKDRYEIKILIILLTILIVIVGLFVCVHIALKRGKGEEDRYQYHFIFVSRSEDSYTANHIYEEAKNYGRLHGAYVEKLKESLNLSYTDSDYVNMAAAMKVDGIILEPSGDSEVKIAIDEAFDENIPTITVLSDCAESKRCSFMELGDHNLGREYGRIIIDIAKTRTPKVMVLVNEDTPESTDRILEGITETLSNEGNHLQVDLQKKEVTGLLNFRLMSLVNDILTSDSMRPDILICMNEKDTKLVNQAVNDYNLAGKTQIIGTGISSLLLKAINEDVISALVDADASQAGMMCIDAMTGYLKNGEINEHIIVEDAVVTKNNVERYLNEE